MDITGPNIINNNIIFYIDSFNIKCYSEGSSQIKDLSDNRHNIIINGPILDRYGFMFDGIDDYCTLPNDLEYDTQLSIFASVKIRMEAKGDFHTIIGNPEHQISINKVNGNLGTQITTNNGEFFEEYESDLRGKNFYIVGFTYDGTNKVTYINGKIVGVQTCSGSITKLSDNIELGRMLNSNNYLNGYLQTCIIYNNALTETEVKLNFNSFKSRYYMNYFISQNMMKISSINGNAFIDFSKYDTLTDFIGGLYKITITSCSTGKKLVGFIDQTKRGENYE